MRERFATGASESTQPSLSSFYMMTKLKLFIVLYRNNLVVLWDPSPFRRTLVGDRLIINGILLYRQLTVYMTNWYALVAVTIIFSFVVILIINYI